LAILQKRVIRNLGVASLEAEMVNFGFVMLMQASIASCMMLVALDLVLYPDGVPSSLSWEM
jgi:hypothetical protein